MDRRRVGRGDSLGCLVSWLVLWRTDLSREDRNAMARHMAAALALLALGTDANAGVPRLLEAYAASPPGATGNRDFSLYDAMLVANSGLPHRRAEMIAGVMAATHHTNAVIRSASANLTRVFPDQLSLWKENLLKMTGDADTSVRIAATWALATEDRGDSDVLR